MPSSWYPPDSTKNVWLSPLMNTNIVESVVMLERRTLAWLLLFRKGCSQPGCFAKAVHSLAKLRTANSLSILRFVWPSDVGVTAGPVYALAFSPGRDTGQDMNERTYRELAVPILARLWTRAPSRLDFSELAQLCWLIISELAWATSR